MTISPLRIGAFVLLATAISACSSLSAHQTGQTSGAYATGTATAQGGGNGGGSNGGVSNGGVSNGGSSSPGSSSPGSSSPGGSSTLAGDWTGHITLALTVPKQPPDPTSPFARTPCSTEGDVTINIDVNGTAAKLTGKGDTDGSCQFSGDISGVGTTTDASLHIPSLYLMGCSVTLNATITNNAMSGQILGIAGASPVCEVSTGNLEATHVS